MGRGKRECVDLGVGGAWGRPPLDPWPPKSSIPVPWPLQVLLFTSEAQFTYLYNGHK